MLTLLCDSCLNKGICRVRELKDELYPHTIITVSNCQRYSGGGDAVTPVSPTVAPVAPAPVQPNPTPIMPRSAREIADVSARIKAITKDKAEDKKQGLVKCGKCGRFILADDAVTDLSSGMTVCETCYDS